jgi:hypothetical protein
MAKATTAKGKAPTVKTPPTVATVVTPSDLVDVMQPFKVSESTAQEEIMRADSLPGVRLEFDFVFFKKLSDDFVATLKPHNQKAYWLSFKEFEDRSRQANIALHSIGTDPLNKILDRPRGKSNPLVRDLEKVQPLIPRFHVTWKVQGGEGDLPGAIETGFRVIRHPKDAEEEKTKSPLEWSGERWTIADGTADPTSGEAIYNVMVAIERQRWEDHLKAMSMASHNAYSQVKQQFYDGAENISKDMLGGKEKILPPEWDLEHSRAEEYIPGKKRD